MADARPAPLTVTLGESVFALGKRAPALVRPDEMADNSPIMVARLVELTVITADKPLVLPPTRLAQIDQVAGKVTGVRTAPMTSYARLKATDGLARWMIKHAMANGWTLTEEMPIDIDALKNESSTADQQPARKTYAVLNRGDASLRIVLEESTTRPQDMKPRAPEPLFLVHTDFNDKPLREAQSTKLFARRKEMTGGTQSVPLSAWLGG